ncbi:MAG: hypothetical protein J6X55_11885 [Victivallales bacterium]|nr:hypothetical protein [Victivallales bacterium]
MNYFFNILLLSLIPILLTGCKPGKKTFEYSEKKIREGLVYQDCRDYVVDDCEWKYRLNYGAIFLFIDKDKSFAILKKDGTLENNPKAEEIHASECLYFIKNYQGSGYYADVESISYGDIETNERGEYVCKIKAHLKVKKWNTNCVSAIVGTVVPHDYDSYSLQQKNDYLSSAIVNYSPKSEQFLPLLITSVFAGEANSPDYSKKLNPFQSEMNKWDYETESHSVITNIVFDSKNKLWMLEKSVDKPSYTSLSLNESRTDISDMIFMEGVYWVGTTAQVLEELKLGHTLVKERWLNEKEYALYRKYIDYLSMDYSRKGDQYYVYQLLKRAIEEYSMDVDVEEMPEFKEWLEQSFMFSKKLSEKLTMAKFELDKKTLYKKYMDYLNMEATKSNPKKLYQFWTNVIDEYANDTADKPEVKEWLEQSYEISKKLSDRLTEIKILLEEYKMLKQKELEKYNLMKKRQFFEDMIKDEITHLKAELKKSFTEYLDENLVSHASKYLEHVLLQLKDIKIYEFDFLYNLLVKDVFNQRDFLIRETNTKSTNYAVQQRCYSELFSSIKKGFHLVGSGQRVTVKTMYGPVSGYLYDIYPYGLRITKDVIKKENIRAEDRIRFWETDLNNYVNYLIKTDPQYIKQYCRMLYSELLKAGYLPFYGENSSVSKDMFLSMDYWISQSEYASSIKNAEYRVFVLKFKESHGYQKELEEWIPSDKHKSELFERSNMLFVPYTSLPNDAD